MVGDRVNLEIERVEDGAAQQVGRFLIRRSQLRILLPHERRELVEIHCEECRADG